LQEYLWTCALREAPILRQLRAETTQLPNGEMQISPEQGQLMHFLVRLMGARRAIEVGTFTGYSSICVASALPADGKMVCCDRSDEWTSIARRYWKHAGLENKIELRLGLAIETLDTLILDGGAGTFDFGFIDADRVNADNYYERILQLLRPGGMVGIDN